MRRPFRAVPFMGAVLMGGRGPEDSTEESGYTIPIQDAKQRAAVFHVLAYMEGALRRRLCACIEGCSLKSVE